jgi:hypothetical protein
MEGRFVLERARGAHRRGAEASDGTSPTRPFLYTTSYLTPATSLDNNRFSAIQNQDRLIGSRLIQ